MTSWTAARPPPSSASSVTDEQVWHPRRHPAAGRTPPHQLPRAGRQAHDAPVAVQAHQLGARRPRSVYHVSSHGGRPPPARCRGALRHHGEWRPRPQLFPAHCPAVWNHCRCVRLPSGARKTASTVSGTGWHNWRPTRKQGELTPSRVPAADEGVPRPAVGTPAAFR